MRDEQLNAEAANKSEAPKGGAGWNEEEQDDLDDLYRAAFGAELSSSFKGSGAPEEKEVNLGTVGGKDGTDKEEVKGGKQGEGEVDVLPVGIPTKIGNAFVPYYIVAEKEPRATTCSSLGNESVREPSTRISTRSVLL